MEYRSPWAAEDLDGDGNIELVCQFGDGVDGYLDIYSAPQWTLRNRFVFPGMNAYMYAQVCNINDDSLSEVFATPNSLSGDARAIVVAFDPASDSFRLAADIQAPFQSYGKSAVADFDGDSRAECLTGSFGGGYGLFEWQDDGLSYVGTVGSSGYGYDATTSRPYPGDTLYALLGFSSPIDENYRYELWKPTSDNVFALVDTFQVSNGAHGITSNLALDFDCDGLDELCMHLYPYFQCWGWDVQSGAFLESCSWDERVSGTFATLLRVDVDYDRKPELATIDHTDRFRIFAGPDCIACDAFGVCTSSTMPCKCDCFADPECDGIVSNVQDVVVSVNTAFRGVRADTGSCCLYSASDVNCDWAVDVLDVVRLVNVAFRGAIAASEYCDPCR